jgi:alcohol dehydrogenase
MYPREAPARLIALIQAGVLALDEWEITSFPLVQVEAAVAHAATKKPCCSKNWRLPLEPS